jgi:hypothetical protein
MKIPGFTAEGSLYKTSRVYRSLHSEVSYLSFGESIIPAYFPGQCDQAIDRCGREWQSALDAIMEGCRDATGAAAVQCAKDLDAADAEWSQRCQLCNIPECAYQCEDRTNNGDQIPKPCPSGMSQCGQNPDGSPICCCPPRTERCGDTCCPPGQVCDPVTQTCYTQDGGGDGAGETDNEYTISHEVVGKSFIGPIRIEPAHQNLDQMRALDLIFSLNENPQNTSRVFKGLGYRMRTQMKPTVKCKNGILVEAYIADKSFDMGWEPIGPPSAALDWIQGKLDEGVARVVSKTPKCATFEIRIGGEPSTVAEFVTCEVAGYTPRIIRHQIIVRVCCDDSPLEYHFHGTKFPSRRLFIDGEAKATVEQGPLEELLRIDHPNWQPMSNSRYRLWVSGYDITPNLICPNIVT